MIIHILGCTSLVATKFLDYCESLSNKLQYKFYASDRNKGKEIKLNNKKYIIRSMGNFEPEHTDLVISFLSENIIDNYVEKIFHSKCRFIDNSCYLRQSSLSKLVIADLNSSDLNKHNIISSPNCSTIQSVYVLDKIKSINTIKAIDYTSMQSISGAGKDAVNRFKLVEEKDKKVVPLIGNRDFNNITNEENKMINETVKLLDCGVKVTARCYRVPLLYYHCVDIRVTFKEKCSLTELKSHLKKFENIVVIPPEQITFNYSFNDEKIYVTKFMKHNQNVISFTTFANNLTVGAALNVFKIFKLTIQDSRDIYGSI